MTPASNSEARKRALIDRAQEWHATRNKPTDPVERLHALADEILGEDRIGALGWRRWIAGRLRRLAYEVVARPKPTTERVRLDQVIGRRLPEAPDGDVALVRWAQVEGWLAYPDNDRWRNLAVADDGTVEVLVETDSAEAKP